MINSCWVLWLAAGFVPLIGAEHQLDILSKMVSKNETIHWLETMVAKHNTTNPYCDICCIVTSPGGISKRCGVHTMCKYEKDKVGPSCRGYINLQFSREEKIALLDAHNTLRNVVATGNEARGNPGPQPNAANMRLLEWNDELENIAHRWALQCIYSNDLCRDMAQYPVGQNIAFGNFATNNDLSFIRFWYEQVADFSRDTIPLYVKDPNTSMFTQMIWADTYQLGCARAFFQVSNGFRVKYREHLVCNYGPTGNIPGQPIYARGPHCTACHEGTSCDVEYVGLCSRDDLKGNFLGNPAMLNDSFSGAKEKINNPIAWIAIIIFLNVLGIQRKFS